MAWELGSLVDRFILKCMDNHAGTLAERYAGVRGAGPYAGTTPASGVRLGSSYELTIERKQNDYLHL
jgi:hypothetical protein